MKNLVSSLIIVLVSGSFASAETSDRFRTADGTECSKRFNSGKSVTTGLKVKENEPEVYLEFTFELGKKQDEGVRIDCHEVIELEQERMRLDNEKLKAELEILKRQLENLNKIEESFEDW